MSYKLIIEENTDYLRCEISGKRTKTSEVKDIVTVWSQIVKTCKKKGITNVLAIFRLKGRPSVMGAYNIVQKAEEFGWNRELSLAVVDTNIVSRKDNLFTATVAVNRGYNIKVFENEEAAIKWLIEV